MNSGSKPEEDSEVMRLRSEVRMLRKAMRSQIKWWYQVPSGVDECADIDDLSPVDALSWIAGLAVREAKAALANRKRNP